MPIYAHKCSKCSLKVEILRNHEEYKDTPKEWEVPESKEEECGKTDHKWERFIEAGTQVNYGDNWGGGPQKGKW